MKTETGLKPKARVFRLLNFIQGIFFALFLVCVIAAGLKISQEPRSTVPISRNDLEIFDHANGDGTYTTLTQTNYFARNGTIDWAGATNVLSMTNQEYYFQAPSDCSITGISDLPTLTNTAPPIVLVVDNIASSNITVRFPAAFQTPDGSRSLVITNGQEGIISVRVNGRASINHLGTNAIGKIFF